jgi:hypothetical protein
LPFQTAIDMAGDQAAGSARDIMQAAQRRASARDTDSGVVRSGLPSGELAKYQDAAARQVSDAQRAAMLGQQALQLQQAGLGSQMAQGGLGSESQRIGTFGNILGDIEGVATQRLGVGGGMMADSEQIAAQRLLSSMGLLPDIASTAFGGVGQAGTQRLLGALGLIPGMQNSATSQVGTYGNLGLGGMENELARMGLGGQFTNQFTGNRLNALGTIGNIMGNQNQYALGLGGLANQGWGGMGSLYNQQFGNYLGGGQLGVNRAGQLGNQWLQADQNRMSQLGQVGNIWQQAMQPYADVTGQLANMANMWGQNVGGAFRGAGNLTGNLAGNYPRFNWG